MKKLLVIFYCIFGMIPTICFGTSSIKYFETENVENYIDQHFESNMSFNDNLYAEQASCKVKTCTNNNTDDEYLHIGNTSWCYESDFDGSEEWCKGETVCILGNSSVENNTQKNACWYAYEDTWDDKWIKHGTLDTCPGYTPDNNEGKQFVFLSKSGILQGPGITPVRVYSKVLTNTQGEAVKSLVSRRIKNTKVYDFLKSRVCVAYVCVANKKYYTCSDNNCDCLPSDGGVVDPNPTDPNGPVDTPVDPITPDPVSSSTLPAKPDKNKDYADHKNTVNDWLQILKKKSN